ncbi:hypothetical protein VTN00DRAFT_2942 [Thermoascus crustaceus]|uniref:uncharacterized protein n=1 Tax=Thermoascus crustaceus TaxID=5088 RepID=UPI003744AC54
MPLGEDGILRSGDMFPFAIVFALSFIIYHVVLSIAQREIVPSVHLDVDASLNIGSTIGTWIGTFFTGICLVAVFSQLRAVLASSTRRRQRFIARAAGRWSSLFDTANVAFEEGLTEQSAPAISGWIQRKYLERASTKCMQCSNQTAGTSSWSQLFQQCSIDPRELLEYGGPRAKMLPTGSKVPRPVVFADVRIEDGKLYYGFTAAEFAALLVIAGFRLTDLDVKGTSSSVTYPGSLYLTDHGPFSQISHFDPHCGAKVMHEELLRLVNPVPIRDAIHLALGVLELPAPRGGRRWVIPPIVPEERIHEDLASWRLLPQATQLNNIYYNLEQLVNVSASEIAAYSVTAAKIRDSERRTMTEILGREMPNSQEALIAAYAIDALEPWSILPVAPRQFVYAMKKILEPYVDSREEMIDELSDALLTRDVTLPNSGWATVQEQSDSLQRLGDVKTEGFCRSSNYCAYYYRAMEVAFRDTGTELEEARKTLAANVAWDILYSNESPPEENQAFTRAMFTERMLEHLDSPRPWKTCLKWAVKVYATYLWGWLHDHVESDERFTQRFRRRVFLG